MLDNKLSANIYTIAIKIELFNLQILNTRRQMHLHIIIANNLETVPKDIKIFLSKKSSLTRQLNRAKAKTLKNVW